jgi:hypothetical protein
VAFTVDDLQVLTAVVVDAWTRGADRDWTAPAGTLEWSCARTADHVVDCVLAPAFFLASRNNETYPRLEATVGAAAGPPDFVEGLRIASTVLVAVVSTTSPDVRAIIWRRTSPELRGPADFVPRGGLELILHAHDVCSGLGVSFEPPRDICERLRQHVQDWPYWASPGWSALTMTGDPWLDLLRSSGRSSVAG